MDTSLSVIRPDLPLLTKIKHYKKRTAEIKTYLEKHAKSLGKVIKGFGNNGEDKSEGCIYKNAIGCYMHGSLLPKNPQLADWLIQNALEVKYGIEIKLKPLDDELENKAHEFAVKKFS